MFHDVINLYYFCHFKRYWTLLFKWLRLDTHLTQLLFIIYEVTTPIKNVIQIRWGQHFPIEWTNESVILRPEPLQNLWNRSHSILSLLFRKERKKEQTANEKVISAVEKIVHFPSDLWFCVCAKFIVDCVYIIFLVPSSQKNVPLGSNMSNVTNQNGTGLEQQVCT